MVEILSAVLTGSGITHGVGRLYGAEAEAQDVGHFHLALDPGPLVGAGPFAERLAALLADLSASPAGSGSDEVLVPGDPEDRAAAERARSGIPLPAFLWSSLRQASEELGVEAPEP